MKLLSTTEYVLWLRSMTLTELCKELPQQFKEPVWTGDKDQMVKDFLAHDAIKWRLAGDHAKLLIKPLKLGMFVPCDSKGEVLEYPMQTDYLKYTEDQKTKYPQECYAHDLEQFEKAEKNVLFKGFKFVGNGMFTDDSGNLISQYRKGKFKLLQEIDETNSKFDVVTRIEDMTGCKNLEVIESAIYHWTYVD